MTDAAMPPGFDPRTTMVPAPWPLTWGPWLQLTQSAFDAWMGLWTAALPQQQAELVLQVQRQALDAWTAPLALVAPPPEPQADPAPRRPMPAIPMARPAETLRPAAAVPAAPEPDVEATVSAAPIAAARPRKAAKPAAELRHARSRKTVPPQRTPRPKTRR